MTYNFDILAFSPHPDDAESGCGGSLLLCAKKGMRVAIADLSKGECSTRGTQKTRSEEKAKASKLLGLSERFSIGLPDTCIGADVANRLPLIGLIRKIRPRVVIGPYWKDRHPDHEAAGELVRRACFFAGVAAVGEGKPFCSERVYYYIFHTAFAPSFVIDISPVWEEKLEVMKAYRSQFFDDDSQMAQTALSRPDFFRYYQARHIFFGGMIGVPYGEPFFSLGPLPASGFPEIRSSVLPSGDLPSYRTI